MKNTSVRISRLQLQHFMNVENGDVRFSCARTTNRIDSGADILGIYGQNGSGKTAFIHALAIVKRLCIGLPLLHDTVNYIQSKQREAKISIQFLVTDKNITSEYFFSFIIRRVDKDHQASAQVVQESLSLKEGNEHKRVLVLSDERHLLSPKNKYGAFVKKVNTHDEVNSLSAIRAITRSQGRSFLFSEELMDLLKNHFNDEEPLLKAIELLEIYAKEYLYIIGVKDNGFINLSIVMPFYFHFQSGRRHSFGALPIRIDGPDSVFDQEYKIIEKFIADLNTVLKCLIPDFQLQIEDLGVELDKKNQKKKKIELLSVRNGSKIPLKYESEGIKKILSLLHVFMGAFNHPSMTVAIDEFDAGIFEYLLGEMLEIFQESGKGQLIFTSHNLRPLEILNKESIVFTTTNPQKRYVRLRGLRGSQNLRDAYYRTILLGGQDEELYHETNQYELKFALQEAGLHEQRD